MLPGSRTRAIWALALFAATQLADGVLTANGVARFGDGIEGNPLLHLIASTAGFGTTLVAAKLVAIGCATVLYLRAHYLTLAVLTLIYVAGAILPWTIMLGTRW